MVMILITVRAIVVNSMPISTCAIYAYITTKVVSSNATHDAVYSIQLYVIKFVSDM